ncbi:MAG: hypothetical protein LBQ66_15175 [Planctomycetaceae bacterium]|nr:hypothetical protein [Planctomycetaceae bacterium]
MCYVYFAAVINFGNCIACGLVSAGQFLRRLCRDFGFGIIRKKVEIKKC